MLYIAPPNPNLVHFADKLDPKSGFTGRHF
jgi:hypothetical protein